MRNFIIAVAGFILLLTSVVPYTVYASEPDDVYGELSDRLDEAFDEYDIGIGYGSIADLSFGELCSLVKDRLLARLSAPLRMLSAILLIIAVSSVLRTSAGGTLGGTSGTTFDMICVLSASSATAPQLIDVYSSAVGEIELCSGFIVVFVPVFTAVSAMCGRLTSAGVYHLLILAASEMITQLSESFLMPVLGVTAALSVMGSVFSDSSLETVAGLLKKVSVFGITLVMTLFTGFVTLRCSIAGKADGAASKTARMLISGMVPVVGGAVSDAYSTVRGSFELIGSTIGAAGVIGIVLLMLPSILELFAYRGVMLIGAAAADMFSVPSVSKLLKSFDSGLSIAQCVLICYSLMFIISSAILAQTIGQG
ncbi:MAG: stage III sporulation protein AE [Ruminococcus sp.]|nr:stage III sporulation protein AE [Ruminococcus sp.]